MNALGKAKRLIIFVVGCTLVLIGFLFLFTPGAGTPILIAGMAILASEFWWAQHLWEKAKRRFK